MENKIVNGEFYVPYGGSCHMCDLKTGCDGCLQEISALRYRIVDDEKFFKKYIKEVPLEYAVKRIVKSLKKSGFKPDHIALVALMKLYEEYKPAVNDLVKLKPKSLDLYSDVVALKKNEFIVTHTEDLRIMGVVGLPTNGLVSLKVTIDDIEYIGPSEGSDTLKFISEFNN